MITIKIPCTCIHNEPCAAFVLIDWSEVVGMYKKRVEFWILILAPNYLVESMELKAVLILDFTFM